MNWMQIVIIVIFVLMIAFEIAINVIGKKRGDQLVELLLTGKFNEFDQLGEQKLTRFTVNGFNLTYMKLNKALMTNDDKTATEIFDFFAKKRMNSKQKESVYLMGYNYFLANEDNERTTFYHDELNKLDKLDKNTLKGINRTYDIVVGKKTEDLDELLKELKKADESQRASIEFLISEIYKNKGDEKNADKYFELSAKHLKEYDEKIINGLSGKGGDHNE